MQQPPPTGVLVKPSFFPLAFLLFLCTPTIVIDGQVYKGGWNKDNFFPMMPGRHTIKIFFKYLYMKECGANSIIVDVMPGQVRRINYYMPPLMLAQGSINVVQ